MYWFEQVSGVAAQPCRVGYSVKAFCYRGFPLKHIHRSTEYKLPQKYQGMGFYLSSFYIRKGAMTFPKQTYDRFKFQYYYQGSTRVPCYRMGTRTNLLGLLLSRTLWQKDKNGSNNILGYSAERQIAVGKKCTKHES